MKVTTKTVQDRITILENLRTISINEEFQLACLRQLLPSINAPAVSLAELVPNDKELRVLFENWTGGSASHEALIKMGLPEEFVECLKELSWESWTSCRAAILRNIESCELDAKRVDFIQSIAEDPALLSGQSGLLKYRFDQHWFAVDGCRETATHYVARLRENGVVTHYAKSLYDFRPEENADGAID